MTNIYKFTQYFNFMNAIIILSGGLDSSVVAYYVKYKLNYKNIKCIFFNYSQRTKGLEEKAARIISKSIGAELIKVEIPWLGKISTSLINKEQDVPKTSEKDMEDIKKEKEEILNWWIPCRNSLFINIALAHAESYDLSNQGKYDVFLGIKDEGKVAMKDTTPEFLKIMNKMAEYATHKGNYRIIAPLMDKDKPETVKLGYELKVPFELTYSCYKGEPDGNHCGYCSNCMQRKKAFHWAGIKDPTKYSK